jgi:PhnB protein
VSDGEAAIALYEKALGAQLVGKMLVPGTKKVMHSCLQIGTSKIFVQDEIQGMPGMKHTSSALYVYVTDVDSQHERAIAAGMTEVFPPIDMFWGDRTSVVKCPFGHHWTFATHVGEPKDDEMAQAMKAFAALRAGAAR